jgi:subtilisin family serine protease
MNPLTLVGLSALMELTSGRPEIMVGLIDGPVTLSLPSLAGENIRDISGKLGGACAQANSIACMHGTFVAGILSARRDSLAPAICPNCTLSVRPIFAETTSVGEQMPSATPGDLAEALIESIHVGARVINLSVALAQPSSNGEHELEEALNYAARLGVIVVAAAGNQGTLASSAITRHPWVIPVVAVNLQGRPIGYSNLGSSIGRKGLGAPGDNITSLGTDGNPLTFGGTSAAAPFVTGAIALLLSEFPDVSSAEVKYVVTQADASQRKTVVPPLLDAWAAHQFIARNQGRR